jgi:hypothetical protein
MSESTKIRVGDLKKMLQSENATWTVNEKLADSDELPQFALGVPDDYPELSPEEKETKVPLQDLLAEGTNNVFLIERRKQEGIPQPLSETNVSEIINPQTSEIIDLKRQLHEKSE